MIRSSAARNLAAAVLLASAAGASCAAGWKADPAASRLEFVATFEGAPVPGAFKSFDARLDLEPERTSGGRLDVTIRTASAATGIPDVDREIASPVWFDYAAFPQAAFRSSDVTRVAAGRYVARGTLTLKGVSRPVDVPFTYAGTATGARIEGELALERGAFRIGTGEWAATGVIGADVKVRFRVALVDAR